MTEGAISYVGFGIIVPEAVFAKRFPGTFAVDRDGERDVNQELIKSLETNLVSIIWSEALSDDIKEGEPMKVMNPNVFIVAKGYIENYQTPNLRIPYQELLQLSQYLTPWFKENFPGYEPGIYLYTKLTGR